MATKLEKLNNANSNGPNKIHVVPSGKVYRQLFEAEVQLVNAYNQVKEKIRENPPTIRESIDGIPLVKEGRAVRGHGFLDSSGVNWINSLPNDPYTSNPFYKQEDEILGKIKKEIEKHERDKNEVNLLPEEVDGPSNGSNVEKRIQNSRKLKYEKAYEDMIQEISTINISLEPIIEATGKRVLERLAQDDLDISDLMEKLQDDESVGNLVYTSFDEIKSNLLQHTDKRKEYIDEMDTNLVNLENQRVEQILNVFKKYSEILYKVYYKSEAEVEKELDIEVEQINLQILQNKITYADLNARLLTADIERERSQVKYLETRREFWKKIFFNDKYQSFLKYIDQLVIPNAIELEIELKDEQERLNENRIGLLNSLKSFKPPESTKTAVYNWHETIMQYTKLLEELNFNYIKTLRGNLNNALQVMMEEIDNTLKWLVDNRIIGENEKMDFMEKKFLPIAGEKQKELEEHLDNIDRTFEEANRITNREIHVLFKYLQGIAHLWDIHELALIKQERSLQEMLQDSRRDHDTENQRREERLDAILDQLRESSSESNLKRLLQFAYEQLDVIKKGYTLFHDNQKEIVKQYPNMVQDELHKYENMILAYFSVTKQRPHTNTKRPVSIQQQQQTELEESDENIEAQHNFSSNRRNSEDINGTVSKQNTFRTIMNEVLNTDRGSIFYVDIKGLDSPTMEQAYVPQSNTDDNDVPDLLALDELIQNTKPVLLYNIQKYPHLFYAFIPVEVYKELRLNVRLTFLNHYETWMDEARMRANTIVAAKFDEIDKELELRVHLHEPRYKRAEMDVHHVRAAELIMHEERVERHCKSIEESMENLQKQYEGLQSKLGELTVKFKDDILNLESDFISATKSLRLKWLQDKLLKDRDRHMDNVKATIRQYHSKFDETLQFIRNSNAKFRKSFYLFSDGGNFSSDEIDQHKKKLERMAILIDKHETVVLKDMEKLEKRQLDEATRIITTFQEKFKFHLVDIEFIEKISRWLNDTQVKIKSEVAASNQNAKRLFDMVIGFDQNVREAQVMNQKRIPYNPMELLNMFEIMNKAIYSRAYYLKCFKDDCMNPFQADLKNIEEEQENEEKKNDVQTHVLGSNDAVHNPSYTGVQAKGPKVNIEDTAMNMIRNIMHYEKTDKDFDPAANSASSTSKKASSTRRVSAQKQRISVSQKQSFVSRRAKTKDEMFAYYCTFGLDRDDGDDFMAQIKNILRESLEGILSNAELYYREVLNQNRLITRPQSIKDSFCDFAETIISKLKSYLHQCSIYLNQSLKEFREILEKIERVCCDLPELIMNESYLGIVNDLKAQFNNANKVGMEKMKIFEDQRVQNISKLKPSLGHPSNLQILNELDTQEKERHEANSNAVEEFGNNLKSIVRNYANNFHSLLAKSHENMLLKFDGILTIDDVNKHDVLPDKHPTSELLRRKMAGIPLEDPEPESIIKRGKGKWSGVKKFDVTIDDQATQDSVPEIVTAKTTLAHERTVNVANLFYQKFKNDVDKFIKYIDDNNCELNYQLSRGLKSWNNSIVNIKKIHE